MDTPHKDNECEKQIMATVESQEFHKRNLKSEFAAWRRKIKPLYEILGTRSNDEVFWKLVMSSDSDDGVSESINSELIAMCRVVHEELSEQVEVKKAESRSLWKDLQDLWNELENNEELGLCFTNAETGILNCLHGLKAQYQNRKIDKTRRLRDFICELRQEISDIWDQCMITEEDKKTFIEFGSCEFTESMLQIHKDELQKWKIYHRKNQEILLKVQKRDTMWKKLHELEAKAADPSRFVNRGGSLLKDQNMHNYLMKNLPKLESELVNLAQKFEEEHGKKMKILGKEIPTMVEEEWEAFKEGKSGRKATRTAPTPPKQNLQQSIRRSIVPPSSTNNMPPHIRPLEKRFGSKLDLAAAPAKRAKIQPLKAIQDG